MKSLKAITFSSITEQGNYIINVAGYGGSSCALHIGTGSEIIEKIKEIFLFDEDDDVEWFVDADEKNGDGWDEVIVYEVPK